MKIVKKMINAMDIKDGMKVAELGAGDGRIAFMLSKAGADVTAVEINPFLVYLMKFKNLLKGENKINILRKDVLDIDYSEFNAVTIYLYPGLMGKLEPKLFIEMKAGSLVVSNTFKFKEHKPSSIIEKRIVIYKV